MTPKATLISMCVALSFATCAAAEGIQVQDPYAITTGVSAQTGAAFMAIHNQGDTDDALIGVQSVAARLVELHSHTLTDDGVMSMGKVTDPVPLPAGGDIILDRGGYHVMFMGLTMPFDDGAMIPVTLVFAVAGEVEVEVPVNLSRLHDSMEMGEMEMGGMEMDGE